MALDLFKFLRKNRKTKKNYDPSKIMDSTEYLKGAKNTRVEIGKPESGIAVIGRADPKLGVDKGAIKPLGGLRKTSQNLRPFGHDTGRRGKKGRKIMAVTGIQDMKASKSDINIFRDQLKRVRNKRKSAAEDRYDKQIKARNERAGFLKKGRTAAERQATYDTAFSKPLGENTMLGRASANREQRQLDMKTVNAESRKKREAAKKKNN